MTVPCANPRLTLTSLLAHHTDRDPSTDRPSPRLVQADSWTRYLSAELSQRLHKFGFDRAPEVGKKRYFPSPRRRAMLHDPSKILSR